MLRSNWQVWPLFVVLLGPCTEILTAQNTKQASLSLQLEKLKEAMASAQAQLEESQRQLGEMRKELLALQQQLAQTQSTPRSPASYDPASCSSAAQNESPDTAFAIQDIRERQTMLESQIATHEQSKVESESKYPVKITGLLLLNTFVNTGAVDKAATPTVALPGSGSTGASVRQTVLGIDARGPHLFGARSYANLRVDFDGTPYSGITINTFAGAYSAGITFLRLRTAHAALQWNHTEAGFSLDHPIVSPDMPSSLTAVAEPALAWSGNLWTWNPQAVVTRDFPISPSRAVRLQGALIYVGDAPQSPISVNSGSLAGNSPSDAERSRWPGVEVRAALLGSGVNEEKGNHIGLGGYFAPHHSSLGENYDSWAATLDARVQLPARLEMSSSFYRGLALGGLGGGAYKDFAYQAATSSNGYYFRPLDDVGGWAQLKERINERVEVNAAFGMDSIFAGEFRGFAISGGTMYQNLARNRTYTGNLIYSPSAYLLISLEYRHLVSSPVLGPPARSDVIGLGAGYRF